MSRFNDMVDLFADGAYFDDAYMSADYNPVTGPGYIDDQGIAHAGVNIWGLRDLVKRVSTLQIAKGANVPLTMMHMTTTNVIPYLSFASVNMDLEWDPTDNKATDAQDRYGLDADTSRLLAESVGLQSGNVGFLNIGGYNYTNHNLRSLAAVALTHEMKLPEWNFGGENVIIDLPAQLLAFGYGEPDCQVDRYWDASQPGKVTSSDPRFKLLVLKRTSTNKALIIVGSYGDATTLDLTLKSGLGMPAGATASNYDSRNPGVQVTKTGNTITVSGIARHEFAMILVQ